MLLLPTPKLVPQLISRSCFTQLCVCACVRAHPSPSLCLTVCVSGIIIHLRVTDWYVTGCTCFCLYFCVFVSKLRPTVSVVEGLNTVCQCHLGCRGLARPVYPASERITLFTSAIFLSDSQWNTFDLALIWKTYLYCSNAFVVLDLDETG